MPTAADSQEPVRRRVHANAFGQEPRFATTLGGPFNIAEPPFTRLPSIQMGDGLTSPTRNGEGPHTPRHRAMAVLAHTYHQPRPAALLSPRNQAPAEALGEDAAAGNGLHASPRGVRARVRRARTRLAPIDGDKPARGGDPSAVLDGIYGGFGGFGGRRRPDRAEGSDASSRTIPKSSNKRQDPLACIGFRTIGPIAAGAFSTVVRARRRGTSSSDAESAEVAVKSFARNKYNKAGWLKTALKNEMDVLSELQDSCHVHIANLIEQHDTPQATHAVLEYCAGGSVHRHLRSLRHGQFLPETMGGTLVQQLSLALAHLHGLGIAHRDVKTENVLYTDASRRRIKLCDYGFAIICHERKMRTVCGSPAYMAPELSTREAYYGPPVDLWALGCFAFEVLHGCPPFRAESLDTLQLRIKRVDHTPFRKSLMPEARRLIGLLLVSAPLERSSAAEAAPLWRQLVVDAYRPEMQAMVAATTAPAAPAIGGAGAATERDGAALAAQERA